MSTRASALRDGVVTTAPSLYSLVIGRRRAVVMGGAITRLPQVTCISVFVRWGGLETTVMKVSTSGNQVRGKI